MNKRTTCPHCRTRYNAEWLNSRQKIKCPKCREVFEVTIELAEEKPDPFIGRTISHYRITNRLGEGGMGVIYQATHLSLNKPVALKILPESCTRDKDFIQRFLREARLAAQLNHENIVQVFDVGKDGDTYYLVMELVEGKSLADLTQERRLDLTETVQIVKSSLKGLARAADKNIVHRDIKPSNILIDSTGRVKITDFGLAKNTASHSALTQSGTVLGTVEYMSPEQCEGKPVDVRSDIYSLGITLYELLYGTVPFRGENSPSVMLKHVKEKLRFPPNFPIPGPIRDIISRMTEKDPAKRYQTPAEALAALTTLEETGGLVLPLLAGNKLKTHHYLLVGAAVLILVVMGIVVIRSLKPAAPELPAVVQTTPPPAPSPEPPPKPQPPQPQPPKPQPPPPKPAKVIPSSLEDLLKMPDAEIEVSRANLIIARKVYPDLKIAPCLKTLDRMAEEIRKRIASETTPQVIMEIISTYLFQEEKFQPVAVSPARAEIFLNWMLENKKGDCQGLTLLYLSLAERLKLPLYPVAAPHHLFVRYDNGQTRFNIEATDRGKNLADDYYTHDPEVTEETLKNGIFLRNLTKKQLISQQLAELGAVTGQREETTRSAEVLDWALKFDPQNALAYHNRAVTYARRKEFDKATADFTRAIELNNNYLGAYFMRAQVYVDKKDSLKAINDFSEVIRINPEFTDAYYWRGKIYVKSLQEWTKAVADLTVVLKADPEKAPAYFLRGYAYEKLGEADKSTEDFRQAGKLAPDSFNFIRQTPREILEQLP